MSDPKQKKKPAVRMPQPKKKLGLVVPPALRLPHDDLIHPDESEPIPLISDQIEDRPTPGTIYPQEQQTPGNDTRGHTIPAGKIARKEQQTPGNSIPAGIVIPQEQSSSRPTVPATSKYLKLPNSILDDLPKVLDPYEMLVYLRLFRLSHGFHKSQCLVGYKGLASGCGVSDRYVRKAMPRLISMGLVKVDEVFNTAEKQGTLYTIFLPEQCTLGNDIPRGTEYPRDYSALGNREPAGRMLPGEQRATNKEDHDDHLKTDHHQRTKTLYEEITGNAWSKADQQAYQQINGIPIGQIETTIRAVHERAKDRPRSLNYFVQEILGAGKGRPTGSGMRRQLEQIIDKVRELHVGGDAEGLKQHVERECHRQGIGFDLDLFDEIISR